MSINLKKSFKKIDIFGLNLTFRIANEKNHKTWVGGLITAVIVGLMLYQLQDLMQSLFKQESPRIVQQQNYVYQPELFNISHKTFSFAFGMQNSIGKHFKDESVYKIIGMQQENHRVFNQTTGNYDLVTVFKEIKISQCTQDHFQISDVKDQFLKLPLNNLYCISLEQNSLGVEGEFSALVFKQLNFQVLECVQSNCTDSKERQSILSNSRFAIYTSDNIIQVTNKDKPYKTVVKNLFWVYCNFLEQEVRYNLMNNYLYTDKGILTNQNTTDRVVNYSSDRVQIYGKTTEKMYNFYIVYEKNKEVVYYRSYLKLDQVLSQLGGIFNFFLILGGILSRPISQLELNRKLINKFFDFDKTQEEEVQSANNNNKQQKINNNNNNSSIIKSPKEIPYKKKFKSQANQQPSQIDSNQQQNQDDNKIEENKIENNAPSEISKKENQTNVKENKRKKLHFSEYLMSIFSIFKTKKVQKSDFIQISSEIIQKQLDVYHIINKLIEFDKLKHLLLNEDQMKLFDFLPKPQLNQDSIKSTTQRGQRRKSSYSTSFRRKLSVNSQKSQLQTEQQNDFIITVEKTKEEKLKDAINAFSVISSRKKTKIDLKLISMVNQNFMQKYRQYQQEQNPNQAINIKIPLYDQEDFIQEQAQTIGFHGNNRSNFQLLSQEEFYSRMQSYRNTMKNSTPKLLNNFKNITDEFKSEESIELHNLNPSYSFKNNDCQLSKKDQK